MRWSCPCLFRSCTPKKVWDTTKGMIGELVPPVRPSNTSVVALLPSISHPTQRDGFPPVLPGTGQKPRHQKVLSRLLSHFGEHLEHVECLEFLHRKDSLSQGSGLTSHGRTARPSLASRVCGKPSVAVPPAFAWPCHVGRGLHHAQQQRPFLGINPL